MNEPTLFPDEAPAPVTNRERLARLHAATEARERKRFAKEVDRVSSRKRRLKSEGKVKAAVRKRDGYRCRDCGISAREHAERFGTDLHVHRVFAGWAYEMDHCISLCRACHAAKKNHEEDDTYSIIFNYYEPRDRNLLLRLAQEARRRGTNLPRAMEDSLFDFFRQRDVPHVARGGDCDP